MLEFDGKQAASRRSFVKFSQNFWMTKQRTHLKESLHQSDVTGRIWTFAIIHLHKGTYRYLQASGETVQLKPNTIYAIASPPYCIYHLMHEADLIFDLTLFFTFMPIKLPSNHCSLLLPPQIPPPDTENELLDYIQKSKVLYDIGWSAPQESIASKIKSNIDETYLSPTPLSDLALSLNLKAANFSKIFKKAFGLTPLRYRNNLRVLDAMLQIVSDRSNITHVAFDVGFEDLGRFYKNFKRQRLFSPGAFKRPKNFSEGNH